MRINDLRKPGQPSLQNSDGVAHVPHAPALDEQRADVSAHTDLARQAIDTKA